MTPKYRDLFTQAAIDEMQRVLNDPEVDPMEHALELSHIIGIAEDGTVEADMLFGNLPAWLAEPPSFQTTGEGTAFTAQLRANPAALILRIRNQAHASICYRKPETGEYLQQQISQTQQETLDAYATAASFHLTGAANGELLTTPPDQDAAFASPEHILAQLEEHLDAVAVYAEELLNRASQRQEDNQGPPAMFLAQGLMQTAYAADTNLTVLRALMEADLDQSRWLPLPTEE